MSVIGPVISKVSVPLKRQEVWNLLTAQRNGELEWWPQLTIGSALGEQVEVTGINEALGKIDVWVAGHALGWSWVRKDEKHATAPLITLRSTGEETLVVITETGFDGLSNAAEIAKSASALWDEKLQEFTKLATQPKEKPVKKTKTVKKTENDDADVNASKVSETKEVADVNVEPTDKQDAKEEIPANSDNKAVDNPIADIDDTNPVVTSQTESEEPEAEKTEDINTESDKNDAPEVVVTESVTGQDADDAKQGNSEDSAEDEADDTFTHTADDTQTALALPLPDVQEEYEQHDPSIISADEKVNGFAEGSIDELLHQAAVDESAEVAGEKQKKKRHWWNR